MSESAQVFVSRQIERLRRMPGRKRIVFPEGNDLRVIAAAERLSAEGLIEPVLLGNPCSAEYAPLYFERRQAKGITPAEAAEIASRPVYHAALMVAAGDADGAVGGAANTTAETARAGLQCIGPAPGIQTISGVFFMCVQDRGFGADGVLAFADCALVIDPTPEQIADIAIATASSTHAVIGVESKIALLSFSTLRSANHPKMRRALEILRARAPELDADGELQADAALVPSIGSSKAPESSVAGHANTLIFPDLASANISYKLVERLGGARAFGPFLQGMSRPFNDLSRGCSADDIYCAAVITAVQSEDNARAAV